MRPMRQLSGSSPNEQWQWQQQKTFSFEHFGQVSYVCSVSRSDCSRSSCSPKSVRKSWQRLTAFSIWAANRTDIIIVFRYPVMENVTAAGSARQSKGKRNGEGKMGSALQSVSLSLNSLFRLAVLTAEILGYPVLLHSLSRHSYTVCFR